MKKFPFLFLLSVIASNAFPQDKHFKEKLVVDSRAAFNFPNAGKQILIEPGLYDSICCHLVVNDNSKIILEFGTAELRHDTLFLTFYNLDPAYGNHFCLINIFDDKFQADYDFKYVLDEVPFKRKIRVRKSKLIVDSKNFLKVKKIAGRVEMEVDCHDGCLKKSDSPLVIKGNFILSFR